MEPDFLHVKGARQHNLKNIDVTLPRNQLVVITGLSGSGKSSLAFDTIYAEGQRRYVESLSSYARQFLDQMGKPDVDTIEGLSPAISIEQKSAGRNPRSIVATVTEIYDYLRILFARVGRPHCYQCGQPITTQTISQMVDQIMRLKEGLKLHVLAPIVRNRKGEYSQLLKKMREEGFVRIKMDGQVYDLDDNIPVDKKIKHNIDLFIDRLILKPKVQQRLADSLETALKHADGIVKVEVLGGETLLFSEKFSCIHCGLSYQDITPQIFSFNSPLGACTQCNGLGSKMHLDPDLVVPNKNISLREGAVIPWQNRSSEYYWGVIESLAKHYKFDVTTHYKNLPKKVQEVLLYGSGDEEIEFAYYSGECRKFYHAPFEGLIPNLMRRYKETDSDWVREDIERYMTIRPCEGCHGSRLKPESLSVKIGDKSIYEITQFSVKKGLQWFEALKLTAKETQIAQRILKEINERLSFMANVGLDYLTLDRSSATLSGGEAQRIRLATQIGSSLVGVLYILDEPSIGLHQRDNYRLIKTLKQLRDLGNTVLIVEHDEETIRASDYIVDMGPGAGIHGGEVVAQGTPKEIEDNKKSVTGQFLAGTRSIQVPSKRRPLNSRKISIVKAEENNLKKIDVDIPLKLFVCVTGVSGSGKSTLVNDTLYKGLAQRLYHSKEVAGKVQDIEGWQQIDKVININQEPIGRTPRSNPATYTGVFTPIRDLFASLSESKMRGYRAGRFSFNVKGGRCEACEGDGILRIEMHFLPDVYVECEVCKGRRFNRETLEIHYKGHSIADVLQMTVEQAFEFFQNIPVIRNKLQTLVDVGLSYIELGQSATTLSGGEAQRLKLSKELSKRATGSTLYILDEPTTGLHFADIEKLLEVLNRLTDAGNTVVVIEHNLDVIKTADYVIDLGPEGGDQGGDVVVTGTPEIVASCRGSYTGQYLKKVL
ncbi:MAG: excinuclease ABC subunit A [Deltaproteobacteria bacterium RIFCSPLOWO2_12_FULL_50_11]|nr:MAG: excinuclease ABC subunit A [Deltaproteobacteria bacterium RIFCSPLOWO2_12_FULL_50_11]